MYQSKLMEALEISFFIAHVKLCIQSGIELLLETAFFSLSLLFSLLFFFSLAWSFRLLYDCLFST